MSWYLAGRQNFEKINLILHTRCPLDYQIKNFSTEYQARFSSLRELVWINATTRNNNTWKVKLYCKLCPRVLINVTTTETSEGFVNTCRQGKAKGYVHSEQIGKQYLQIAVSFVVAANDYFTQQCSVNDNSYSTETNFYTFTYLKVITIIT